MFLSVLKSSSSCGLGKVIQFGYGVEGIGLLGSLQLRSCLNGKLYLLIQISCSKKSA